MRSLPSVLLVLGLAASACPLAAQSKKAPPEPSIGVTVLSDRILYAPGEPAEAVVTVTNTTDADADLSAKVTLINELSDASEVGSRRVSVPAGGTVEARFPFTAPEVEYGQELRVELTREGEPVASHADYFSVADNLWKVCIGHPGSGPIANSHGYSPQQIAGTMAAARKAYSNWIEKDFWAPDDWGNLTPEPGTSWHSGQAARRENTENIRLLIEEAHKHGIKAITYGKCMSGGPDGWERARAMPQWYRVDELGRTTGRPADVWDMDNWNAGINHYRDAKYIWTYRWPDLRRTDVLQHGIDELIASTKQFGWDGVRFDSCGFRDMRGRSEAVNVRNYKELKKQLWEAFPGYLLGNNTNNRAAIDGREYPLSADDPISHEVREAIAGGQLWMGEAMREFPPRNGSVKYRTWSQFADDELRCVRTIKQLGGHFCYSYDGTRGGKHYGMYQYVIGTLIGAHQYLGTHRGMPGSESWGAFLTRWGGLVWDHRLRPLPEAGEVVSVASERPLWWEQFANERVVSPDRRFVIVHLLNPPLSDDMAELRGSTPKDELPPPVADAVVRFRPRAGETVKQTFFVSPGEPNRAERLGADGADGAVRVPEFPTWAMVVFECEGRYELPKEPPVWTEPMSEGQTAEVAEVTKGQSIAVADDLSDPTPQHDPEAIKPRAWSETDIAPPEGLKVGGGPGLDVLVITGFYHYVYDIPEAIRRIDPEARVNRAGWVRNDKGKGHVQKIPEDYESLFAYDMVVLVNMSAGSMGGTEGAKRLADFVKAGGRLVILGGPWTLGQGHFRGSPLDEIMPVEVREARDIYELPEPLPLGTEPGEPSADRPLVYYFHAVKPRDDGRATLWAGPLPVFHDRKIGAGSCGVFSATMLGRALGEGQTPYWEAESWPETFGKVLLGR